MEAYDMHISYVALRLMKIRLFTAVNIYYLKQESLMVVAYRILPVQLITSQFKT